MTGAIPPTADWRAILWTLVAVGLFTLGALSRYPTRAGTASALVGAIQFGGGIFGATLAAAFADGTPWPMAAMVALGGLGSAVCAWGVISPAVTRRDAAAAP